jgi:hypothetical protein
MLSKRKMKEEQIQHIGKIKGKFGNLPEVAVERVKKAKPRLDPKSLPKVGVPGLPNANIIRLFCTEEDGIENM